MHLILLLSSKVQSKHKFNQETLISGFLKQVKVMDANGSLRNEAESTLCASSTDLINKVTASQLCITGTYLSNMNKDILSHKLNYYRPVDGVTHHLHLHTAGEYKNNNAHRAHTPSQPRL